jgi:hypothetical protein
MIKKLIKEINIIYVLMELKNSFDINFIQEQFEIPKDPNPQKTDYLGKGGSFEKSIPKNNFLLKKEEPQVIFNQLKKAINYGSFIGKLTPIDEEEILRNLYTSLF